MKNVLTIAGSDCSGGAGIQADLKAMSANGVYAMSVITALTAQNTQGVFQVEDVTPEMVCAQLDAIFTDIEVHAVKIGMVSKVETILAIASKLKQYQPTNVVLDPVMISKSGYSLLQADAKQALIQGLLPLATLITPNLPEAEEILSEVTGVEVTLHTISDMENAVKQLFALGCKNVLLKGGHLAEGNAVDIFYDGQEIYSFTSERIRTKNTHGTGCTLSSAIAAQLGRGETLLNAISLAKQYITTAIAHSLAIGHGVGPTNHFYDLYQRAGFLEE